MKFEKRGHACVVSDCGAYTINKAGQGPGRIVYMAVAPRGVILGTWRCANEPEARADAYRQAVNACEEHARG